jgi:hypothetical protein
MSKDVLELAANELGASGLCISLFVDDAGGVLFEITRAAETKVLRRERFRRNTSLQTMADWLLKMKSELVPTRAPTERDNMRDFFNTPHAEWKRRMA